MSEVSPHQWKELHDRAWLVRECAHVHGATQVGVAVLSEAGGIFTGCNVEHVFRSHDVHAEVNALTNMVSAGYDNAQGVAVVATREKFTPCGSCLDWIFELGSEATLVSFQGKPNGPFEILRADQLMPYYPC